METENPWFHSLATMPIPGDSSISYRFLFHESEPSNAAAFDVFFYSDQDLKEVSHAMLKQVFRFLSLSN